MTAAVSLRARLTAIILLPLLVISMLVGLWAYRDSQLRAAERFDRSLLSTALAISRDTALSGGDALSQQTRDQLLDTSGGPVFYHVYAPDGVFVTGYATPPVLPPDAEGTDGQTYFEAQYLGRPVRVLRFEDAMTVDGLSGQFTFTVWQDTGLRDGFVASLSQRTFGIIATLLIALSLIVWFGVRLGLRPLVDLQDAIARRSADDLAPIKRPIPPEVGGIVGTLNGLLAELTRSFRAKDDFISNAAHQLRNPIAGVLSLSEAVHSAPTLEDARHRSGDLIAAARETSALANSLLAYERARSATGKAHLEEVDLWALLRRLAPRLSRRGTEKAIPCDTTIPDGFCPVRLDPLLMEQAILNLVDNALVHGGPGLSRVSVEARAEDVAVIEIRDDGIGLDQDQVATALERFGQPRASSGSGLGLPIAETAARLAGGALRIRSGDPGLRVRLEIPYRPQT